MPSRMGEVQVLHPLTVGHTRKSTKLSAWPPVYSVPRRGALGPACEKGSIVRYTRRAALLLSSFLAFSCHRSSGGGPKGSGAIEALDVEEPAGSAGAAVSKCDRDGSKCSAIAKSDVIAPGTLVKTGRGARASFSLGASANLDGGEESAVCLASPSGIQGAQ